MSPRHALLMACAITSTISAAGTTVAAGAVRAPRHYEISMDLAVDGRRVAAPSAIVETGKPADITLHDKDSAHGWRFEIVVDKPMHLRHGDAIPATIRLFEIDHGAAALRAEPHVGVAPGQRATLDLDLVGAAPRKAHLSVQVQPLGEADLRARIADAKRD